MLYFRIIETNALKILYSLGENDVFGDIKIIVFLSNRYLRNRLVFQFNYLQLQKSLHSFKFGPICENKSEKKMESRKEEGEWNEREFGGENIGIGGSRDWRTCAVADVRWMLERGRLDVGRYTTTLAFSPLSLFLSLLVFAKDQEEEEGIKGERSVGRDSVVQFRKRWKRDSTWPAAAAPPASTRRHARWRSVIFIFIQKPPGFSPLLFPPGPVM